MEMPEHLLVVYQVLDSAVLGQTGVKELHQDAALSPFRYGAVDERDVPVDVRQTNPAQAAEEVNNDGRTLQR